MITTETEASKKWCPQALSRVVVREVGGRAQSAAFVDVDGTPGVLCIASRCMFWRWGQKPNPAYVPRDQNQMVLRPHDPRTEEPAFISDEGGRGFCGAAGRP